MEPDGTWETFTVDTHDLCVAQCVHDREHAESGCCGGAEEREAWACTCECHAGQGDGRYRRGKPRSAVPHYCPTSGENESPVHGGFSVCCDSPELHRPVHDYVSTACVHEEHGQCRVTCKFCPSECRCACHAGKVEK